MLGEDFRTFVGLEELSFPMMSVGAYGLMNAVGNLRPSALAELCQAVWKNDLAMARRLRAPISSQYRRYVTVWIFSDAKRSTELPIRNVLRKIACVERRSRAELAEPG